MIQKKICMLGAFAVGKTSLVRQYVESIFSEKYQSTLGVKIDKKRIKRDDKSVTLLLWDIQGKEESQDIRDSYLRGAAGYMLVIDGTRPETWKAAVEIHNRKKKILGKVPFIVLINKADLVDEWDVKSEHLEILKKNKWSALNTSAKTGEGVDQAFYTLTDLILTAK